MLVKQYMDQHPCMIDPDMPVMKAHEYAFETKAFQLPVVGGGKRFVGLVTRQTLMIEPETLGNLSVWEITRYLAKIKVKDVMIKKEDVIWITPEVTIEEAAQIMVNEDTSCLPVLEEGRVVGLLTRTDLLAHLTQLLALDEPALRMTVRIPNRSGETVKLLSAFKDLGLGIITVVGAVDRKNPDKWVTVIKVPKGSQDRIKEQIAQLADHELLDLRET